MSNRSSANGWRAIVLSAWAAGLIALLVLGRYTLFIRAQLWPLLLASLVIVMLFLVAMAIRPAEHGRVRAALWLRGGLLMLPLLYMLPMFSKSALAGLNSFALEKRSLDNDGQAVTPLPRSLSAAKPPATQASPLPAEKVLTLEYVHEHRRDLIGQHVLMDGRVSKTDAMPKGQIVLYRFVIVCCAADAMPVQMKVLGSQTASLANDQWVRVGGTVVERTIGTRTIPVVEADSITPIPAPADPYLSAYQY